MSFQDFFCGWNDFVARIKILTIYKMEAIYSQEFVGLTQAIEDLPDDFLLDDENDQVAEGLEEIIDTFLPELERYGNKDPNWLKFLSESPSAVLYRNRVNDFLAYHSVQPNNGVEAEALEASLIKLVVFFICT